MMSNNENIMILEFYFTLMNIKTFNKNYPKAFVLNISTTIHGIKHFRLLILSDMTKTHTFEIS